MTTLPTSICKDGLLPIETVDVVARELRRRRLQAALDASAGAWSDEDHLDLTDGPAIDRWIAGGRVQ